MKVILITADMPKISDALIKKIGNLLTKEECNGIKIIVTDEKDLNNNAELKQEKQLTIEQKTINAATILSETFYKEDTTTIKVIKLVKACNRNKNYEKALLTFLNNINLCSTELSNKIEETLGLTKALLYAVYFSKDRNYPYEKND